MIDLLEAWKHDRAAVLIGQFPDEFVRRAIASFDFASMKTRTKRDLFLAKMAAVIVGATQAISGSESRVAALQTLLDPVSPDPQIQYAVRQKLYLSSWRNSRNRLTRRFSLT